MLDMIFPRVGVFHVRSDDRVVQATAVRRLLSFARGEENLSFSGQRVLLIPDPLWLTLPIYGRLVTEIAVALGRRGATVLMMDTFRTGESEPEASTAEFAARGGEAGLSWRMVSFDRLISTTIRPDGQTFKLPELASQVDLVLNIACLFAEPRARLAGAMYNMIGLLCGRNRRNCRILTLDPESLNDAMVDVVSRIVPDLNIVLVPEVLRRFDHDVCDRAQLLVSADVVAVDALAASLAGFESQEIPAINLAAESGLGIGWTEAIRLVGDRPLACEAVLSVRPGVTSPEKKAESTAGTLCGRVSGSGVSTVSRASIANRSIGVTICPDRDSVLGQASVATCVGGGNCDTCGECEGDCSTLLH